MTTSIGTSGWQYRQRRAGFSAGIAQDPEPTRAAAACLTPVDA